MGKNLYISARNENALDALGEVYLSQYSDIIFQSGLKYLSSLVNPIFEGEGEISAEELRRHGLPDGLIKIAIDLSSQGYEGISGFHDLERIFEKKQRFDPKVTVFFDSGCVEAAVTGRELSSNVGHIRAPKLWQCVHDYIWQGCRIILAFSENYIEPPSIEASYEVRDLLEMQTPMQEQTVALIGVANAFKAQGLAYNSAGDRQKFVEFLKAEEERLGCAFILKDIDPQEAIFVYDGDEKHLAPDIGFTLHEWGYSPDQIKDINLHVLGWRKLPEDLEARLKSEGLPQEVINRLKAAVKTAEDLRYVFTKWIIGEDTCRTVLGLSDKDLEQPLFDILNALGVSKAEIAAYNTYCFGAQSLKDAPHLSSAHKQILCQHELNSRDKIEFVAAIENTLAGTVDAVIQVPHETDVETLKSLSFDAWSKGIKRLTLARENSDWESAIAFTNIPEVHNQRSSTETKTKGAA